MQRLSQTAALAALAVALPAIGYAPAAGSAVVRRTAAPPAVVAAGTVDVPAPSNGPRVVQVPVTATGHVAGTISVRWTVTAGSATLGTDVAAATGVLSLSATHAERTISVSVLPDPIAPTSSCWFQDAAWCRTFSVSVVVLSGRAVAGATLDDSILWTSTTSGSPPTISAGDGLVASGGQSAPRSLYVPITLSSPATRTVSASYALVGASAIGGRDFARATGTVSFAAGQTVRNVVVHVLAAAGEQPDEVLSVVLSKPVGAQLARSVGVAIIATTAPGVPAPLDASYAASTFTQVVARSTGVPNTYAVRVAGAGTTITGSPVITNPDDRMAFWPRTEAASTDQQACAEWSAQTPTMSQHGSDQQGLVLRLATADGVTRAITVTKNVYEYAYADFNVHVWNTSLATPFRLVGQFNLAPFFKLHLPFVLPWLACARVVGSTLDFEVWLPGQAVPAWGDSSQGGTMTLPAGWDYPGVAGYYAGHVTARAQMTYAKEYTGVPTSAPLP